MPTPALCAAPSAPRVNRAHPCAQRLRLLVAAPAAVGAGLPVDLVHGETPTSPGVVSASASPLGRCWTLPASAFTYARPRVAAIDNDFALTVFGAARGVAAWLPFSYSDAGPAVQFAGNSTLRLNWPGVGGDSNVTLALSAWSGQWFAYAVAYRRSDKLTRIWAYNLETGASLSASGNGSLSPAGSPTAGSTAVNFLPQVASVQTTLIGAADQFWSDPQALAFLADPHGLVRPRRGLTAALAGALPADAGLPWCVGDDGPTYGFFEG